MNNGNVSRHLFTCLSKCFASFKHENSNSCEMAVNFFKYETRQELLHQVRSKMTYIYTYERKKHVKGQ